MTHPAAGLRIDQLDTPALLLDLDVLEENIRRMSVFLLERGVRLRPHVKAHRATPQIARKQLEAGAIGLTCAKLSEAEALAAAGFHDLLIANQVVSPGKIDRLAALAGRCDLKVAVDSAVNAAALSRAALRRGTRLGVLVEVNIGHNRCGVAPFEPTLALARTVSQNPGLVFRGLMGYDGHCTTRVTESERGPLALQANRLLAETRRYVEAAGLPVEILSGSGTFTYRYAAEVAGITEIQAGSYLLIDSAYQDLGVREFDCPLRVMATVTSRPSYPGAGRLAVIDAGRKSVSVALGNPMVRRPAGAEILSLSDEHGRVILEDEASPVQVGDPVELWVRDTNGTINQFDRFYAVRNDLVEAVWEIPLRGNHT
jgi:D-serine deaminase-like pyridoxal phosphate-dependent protein